MKNIKQRLLLVLLLLVLTFLYGLVPQDSVRATSITVNTVMDLPPNSADGLCSLRAAIAVAQANSNASDTNCVTGLANQVDVIQIDPSLAGQTLLLTHNPGSGVVGFDVITVSGANENRIEIIGPTTNRADFVINANFQTRPFYVGYIGFGSTDFRGYMKLSNLTIRGGNGKANNAHGGFFDGLNNRGGALLLGEGSELTLDNVEFRNNSVVGEVGAVNGWGGAIFADAGKIISNGGAFVNNTATSTGINGRGGAIFMQSEPSVLEGYAVRFQGNTASYAGGVIAFNPGTILPTSYVTLQRSLITGNSAPNGGVAYVESAPIPSPIISLNISDSTVSGNTAGASGGVVFSLTTAARFEFYRSTFHNNTAGTSGGLYYASKVAIFNSIISDSTCFSPGASVLSGVRTLVRGTTTGCSSHDVIGTITNFDTNLQQNGGSQVLESHRLIAGSNAIDNGSQAYCGTMDQRTIDRGINGIGGVNSPQPGDCDIGAYEYAPYVINFVTGTSTVTESNVNHPVGIKLTIPDPSDSPLAVPLTVTASTSGSASAGDFSIDNSGTATFPAGSVTGTIVNFSVDTIDDFIAEQTAETVILTASAPGAALAAPTSHTVSIQDNDTPGIDVDNIDGSIVVSEITPGTSDNFRIKLQSQPDFNADVLVKILPDKQCGINNTGRAQQYNLTITNANWQTWHNVSVQPFDDWVDDDDEVESAPHQCVVTYDFDSSDPVYNNTFDTLYVTVFDNDVAGVNIVQNGGNIDLSEDGVTDTYTIALNSQPNTDPTLVTTVFADPDGQCRVNGGAVGAEVAVATFSSPSMAADPFDDWVKADWETPKTVTVTANDDPTVEPDGDQPPGHHCVITHRVVSTDARYTALNNAGHPQTMANDTISADIVDNDPPFVDIAANAPITVSEATAGTADTYTVVLYRQPLPGNNVTINLSVPTAAPIGDQVRLNTVNNAATATLTRALTFTPANWNVPQTVYVFAVNDDYDEDKPHSINIAHSITSTAFGFSDATKRRFFLDDPTHAGPGSLNTINVPVTITDNDISEVINTPTTVNITEGGAAGNYAITLATHPYDDVTVTSTPSSRCNLGSGPGVAVNTLIAHATWNTPHNVPITVVNDELVEVSYTCLITHSVASTDTKYSSLVANTQYGPDDVTVNVTDDDLPNILLTAGGIAVSEATAGTADSYTVVLENQPTADVVVNLSVPSVAPIGNQILLNTVNNAASASTSIALTFTNGTWNTPQTVYVFAVNDDYDETDPHPTQINHSITSSALGFSTTPAFIVDGGAPSPNTAALTVNITDNDTSSVIVAEIGTTDITENGGQDTYTIKLGTIPYNPVTVTIVPDAQCGINGGAAGASASINIDPANWNSFQTVTVTANDDPTVEGPHTCAITHTTSSVDPAYEALDGPIANGPANVTANITDNDNPEVDINTVDGVLVSESTATTPDTYSVVLARQPLANVTVNLSVPSPAPIGNQVTLNSVNNAATAATTLGLTFTPANWNTAQNVFVFAVNDSYDENDPHSTHITHTLTSTAYGFSDPAMRRFFLDDPTHAGSGSLDTIDVSVTITDDDIPGVQITESGGTNVTEASTFDSYDVVLTSQPFNDVTITLTFGDEITVEGGSSPSVTLTFTNGNWNTPQQVDVVAVDDREVEGPHSATISHAVSSSDIAYQGIIPAPSADVTVNINDNDTVTIAFASANGPVAEAVAFYSVNAVLMLNTSGTGTELLATDVSAAITETGTAINPADYTLASTSVDFTAGAITGATDPVDLTIVNDMLVEGDQSVTLGFGTMTGPASGSGTHIVTITDNDTATVEFASGTGSASEATTPYTTNARLNITSNPAGGGALESTVSVVINHTPGSASTPADYTPVSTSVDFAALAADGALDTVDVTIDNDDLVEGDEAFVLSLGGVTGAASLGSTISQTVTITDNDTATVTFASANGNAPESNSPYTVNAVLTINSNPSGGSIVNAVSVDVNQAAGTAATPDDYTLTTTSVTFGAGSVSDTQPIDTTIVNDTIAESAENFTLSFGTVTGVATATGSHIVTIMDDDTPGVLITESGTTNVTEGSTSDSYNVVLASQPTSDVTITLAFGNEITVEGENDGSVLLTFTSGNWNSAQQVDVVAVDDREVEGNHSATITHTVTSSDGGYQGIIPSPSANVTVNISDNDTAAITFASTGNNAAEAINTYSANAVLTLTTSGTGAESLVVPVSAAVTGTAGTATTPADYSLTTSSVDFTAGAINGATDQVDATIVSDLIVEGNQDFTLGFGTVTGPASASGTHVVTITDDDSAVVTFASASGNAPEATTPYSVNTVLTLTTNGTVGTPAIEAAVSVDVSQTAGTAATPADYSLTTTSVTFAAGTGNNATQHIDTAIVNDDIDEDGEDFTLGFGMVTGQATASGTHVVTITDDDTAGVTVTQSGTTDVSEGSTTDSYDVILTSEPTNPVTITLTFGNDITVEGENDGSVTLTFDASNWDAVQTVDVVAVDDREVEGTHTDTIVHAVTSSDGKYSGITPAPAANVTVNISDNDSATIAFANGSGNTPEATTPYSANAVLTLTTSGTGAEMLSTAVSAPILSAGTATAPADYSLTSSSADFAAGAVNGAMSQIDVAIVSDALVEGDQDFTLTFGTITGPASASGITSHTVTITDDDSAAITFASGTGNAPEATTPYSVDAVLTLTTVGTGTPAIEAAVDVAIDQTPGTAITPADYSLTTTSVTFAAGAGNNATQSVDTAIVNDVLDEDNEDFTLNLGAVTGQATASGSHVVTIIDDDTAGITITESGTTDVTEGGAPDTYTIVLNAQPTSPVTITLTFNSANAMPTTPSVPAGILVNNQLSPVVLIFTDTDWNQAQTVSVLAPDDFVLDAGTENIVHDVDSADVKFAAVANATVVVNIADGTMVGPNGFALLRPADDLFIPNVTALTAFRWQDPVNAGLFDLTVNQTLPVTVPNVLVFNDFTRLADSDALTCDGTECVLTLTAADQAVLTNGTYEWTVTAINGLGTTPAHNQPFSFTIDNAGNLLQNGGFEIAGAKGKRSAENWVLLEKHELTVRPLVTTTISRRICKPAKAFEGNCAFRLGERGSYNWSRMLRQKIANPSYGINGDILTLSAQVNPSHMGQHARMLLVVKYPGQPRQKLSVKIKRGNYDYRLVTGNLTITGKPSKIVVAITTGYNTGFLLVDDVQLILTPINQPRTTFTPTDNWLSLPAAPSK